MVRREDPPRRVKDLRAVAPDRTVTMGLMGFFRNSARLLRTISKPNWKTFWLSIKICFFGVAILGGIGYLIRLIAVTIST